MRNDLLAENAGDASIPGNVSRKHVPNSITVGSDAAESSWPRLPGTKNGNGRVEPQSVKQK